MTNIQARFKKGFTLIELLVVIAIIGILSAVVLASLNSARAKGADAAVKSDLATIRNQAEIYFDDTARGNGTYGAAYTVDACPETAGTIFYDDVQIRNAIAHAALTGGTTVALGTLCATDGANYAVMSKLKSGTTDYWCIDSSGVARTEPSLALDSTGLACI